MSTPAPALDLPRIRGALAAQRVSRKQLADAAGLSRHYVSTILCGRPCGELATIKIISGLQALGLEREAQRAS